jgi:glycosyltransferase involved in cell wall biosynthesis
VTVSDSTSSDPFVTIAIPTFNRAPLLKRCIAAALAQSYRRFEVLVSNNASTDNTDEVLRSFDDRRLRSIKQETNTGLIANWNACLAQAKGEYIVFVSDDDLVEPWLLDRCIGVVRSEPGVPIVIALSDISFSSGYRLQAIVNHNLGTGVWDGTDILNEVLDGSVFAPMCTTLLRTEALRASGGFPVDWGTHSVDKAAWIPLLLTGRAGLVNKSCGTVATHDGTVTSNLAIDAILRDIWRLVDLIAEVADRSIRDSEKRREIEQRAKRYFALCAVYLIDSRRRGGTTLAEAVSEIWPWRSELVFLRLSDLHRLARPLANILLPRPAIQFLRLFARAGRRLGS